MLIWKVSELSLTSEAKMYGIRAPYLFHVAGEIIEGDNRRPFSWTVPALSHPAYDIADAMIEPDAARLLALLAEMGTEAALAAV